MTNKQIFEAYLKSFLAIEFMNGQLYMFKDRLKFKQKRLLESAIQHTNSFLKMVRKDLTKEGAEDQIDSDIDLITTMFDAFVQAEEKGITYKFKNDFNKICAENNIKN